MNNTPLIDENICNICKEKFDEERGYHAIECDNCNKWYHIDCAKLSHLSKIKLKKLDWSCDECVANFSSTETGLNENDGSLPDLSPIIRQIRGENDDHGVVQFNLIAEPDPIDNTATATTNTISTDDHHENENNTNEVKCKDCGKSCKGFRGLKIHISMKHADKYSQSLISKYSHTVIEPQDVTPSDITLIHESKNNTKLNKHVIKINELIKSCHEKLIPLLECFDVSYFNILINELINILKEANDVIPGPIHPARKFYQIRKNKKFEAQVKSDYKKSNNPYRTDKRKQQIRKDKYNYELIQHEFFFKRKRCVQKLFNADENIKCSIPLEELHESFSNRWSIPNNCIRANYTFISHEDQESIDSQFNLTIKDCDVESVIKSIKTDSACGPDGILPKTIKTVNCKDILATITEIMLRNNVLPKSFSEAKTVLVFKKKGSINNVDNWRPISISSVLRRVVEKIIVKKLNRFVNLNTSQKGFTNIPGCHVNTTILNGCLKKAKANNEDFVAIILDGHQAYDTTGHLHMLNSLHEQPIPSSLRNLSFTLQTNNVTRIYTSNGISKTIILRRGIFQGSSLSPIVFNTSINYVFNELNNPVISSNYGFKLDESVPNISILGFVDDLAPLSNSRKSAIELCHLTENLLNETGYKISKLKSKAIILEKGILSENDLILKNGESISSVKNHETIKYLGVTYNDEIILDKNSIITKLSNKLSILASTPLLHVDQKLKILNVYLWPIFIYQLQTTPLEKIDKKFLHDLDKIIRSFTEEILTLPHDITNHLLYSSKKYKGPGIIRSEWEANLQVFNICSSLIAINDPYVNISKNLEEEKQLCLKRLNISQDSYLELKLKLVKFNARRDKCTNYSKRITEEMRSFLREREFKSWCDLPYKGKGVILFKECPYANAWISNKSELTYNMWTSSIKMIGNVASNRSNPGRSQNNNRCRIKFCNEIETLGHILGICSHASLLRNVRHNEVRTIIANAFREKKYSVYEEVHCLSEDGSNRRIDIIAIEGKTGYVIDPTILMETSSDQPKETDKSKKVIYEPCIPYLLEKYKINKIEIIGLMVGARGTIINFFEDFRKRFKLNKELTQSIVMSVLKGSCNILHNHLYNY